MGLMHFGICATGNAILHTALEIQKENIDQLWNHERHPIACPAVEDTCWGSYYECFVENWLFCSTEPYCTCHAIDLLLIWWKVVDIASCDDLHDMRHKTNIFIEQYCVSIKLILCPYCPGCVIGHCIVGRDTDHSALGTRRTCIYGMVK